MSVRHSPFEFPIRARRRLRWALPLLSAAVLAATGCDLPRDPEHSLDRARGGVLRVGVSESPPWVIRSRDLDAEPEGVEPEMIRAFARSIDASVDWVWGSPADHMEALAGFDLDVVAAGLTGASPWKLEAGFTQPYLVNRTVVGGRPDTPPPREHDLDNRDVAVPASGGVAAAVRELGGRPVPDSRLVAAGGATVPASGRESTAGTGLESSGGDGRAVDFPAAVSSPPLAAGPTWLLDALGYDTVGPTLGEHRRVLAVPPGENGLLTALEHSIGALDIPALVRAATDGWRRGRLP